MRNSSGAERGLLDVLCMARGRQRVTAAVVPGGTQLLV